MPPAEAIQELIALNGGRDPELHALLQEALTLPEEAQRDILKTLLAPKGEGPPPA